MNSIKKPHISNEIISATDFIDEYKRGKRNIERSFIIPPELGKPGFGKIFVTFGIPGDILKPESDRLNKR